MMDKQAASHLPPFGTILGPRWPPATPVYNFLDPEQRKSPWVEKNRSVFAVKLYFMGKER